MIPTTASKRTVGFSAAMVPFSTEDGAAVEAVAGDGISIDSEGIIGMIPRRRGPIRLSISSTR